MEDVRRARELYRYLQPDNLLQPRLRRRSSTFDLHHDHVPSLSNALAPFCQLALMRCHATKAMLNVMDRDVMYFLAEASLGQNSSSKNGIYEFVEDPIMSSCSTIPLKGRICEMTLRVDQPEGRDQVPTFVVPDLADSQFANINVVEGPPFYRFYAGVPLTTRDGINIGSLAIMDTTARPGGLTCEEEGFLGRSVEQIMTYLETNRQAIEGRRSRRMAEGLESFISGKRSIGRDNGESPTSDKAVKKKSRSAYGISPDLADRNNPIDDATFKYPNSDRQATRSNSIISLESDVSNSTASADDDGQRRNNTPDDSRSHVNIFTRAANLLRESLGDLGDEGSVHFISLSRRLSGNVQKSQNPSLTKSASVTSLSHAGSTDGSMRASSKCCTIASSTHIMTSTPETDESCQIVDLYDDMLRSLMRRYPGGRMWSLEGMSTTSSEDDTRSHLHEAEKNSGAKLRRTSRRRQSEHKALRAAFPGARQLLFTPVWDATVGSFTHGCFITTALETRSFSPTTDLPFLNSFCSTVMAECSRLDTMIADRQKSDFVGTISHEMRSPLHGVLASVEFLAETELTSFQKSLIETIDSCGRTLLDTINHVLDFSKVNSFEKHWQASNKRHVNGSRRSNHLGPENSSKALSFGAPPLLQLFGVTDVSTVLEEVVDGLVLGHTYKSGIEITDTSREARGRATGKTGDLSTRFKPDPVDIFLDVQQNDWTFITQPGAVRRIIMNITGNAIKYTTHGMINVQLRLKSMPTEETNTQLMVFTVTDTGKGISPEFLASKLFVPFAQENALAPGTGLGMSIVKSIVLMLGGTIDVKSVVNKGTTVEVTLPLKRPMPGQTSTQTTPHSNGTAGTTNSNGEESILLLQNQAAGETVSFYRSKQVANDPLVRAVGHYVQQWYGLDFVDPRMLESSSVVIVEEQDLENLMTKAIGTPGKRPALVVMCSVSSRHSTSLLTSLEERLSSPVEFMAKPCGPNKLARSIRQALEKKHAIKPRPAQATLTSNVLGSETIGGNATMSSACDPAGETLQEMDLSPPFDKSPGMVVQATENFAASQMSQRAQTALSDINANVRTPRAQMSDNDAFPFPVQPEEKSRKRREGNRSRGVSFEDELALALDPSEKARGHDAKLAPARVMANSMQTNAIDPHVLLVDDNNINLKLLETFLRAKRKYTQIVKAVDGQKAVDAVMSAPKQFDIIFMDISMPVMNGFEATRAIRDFEEQCNVNPGAMVIALTGLASGRDQSEGFDSGCDIYMTKPVSFKEVGKLLDNWESHQISHLNPDMDMKMANLNLTSQSSTLDSASNTTNRASWERLGTSETHDKSSFSGGLVVASVLDKEGTNKIGTGSIMNRV